LTSTIRRGTYVSGKTELANLLGEWLRAGTETTIGETGTYGGVA
jgi:hypothetical protein